MSELQRETLYEQRKWTQTWQFVALTDYPLTKNHTNPAQLVYHFDPKDDFIISFTNQPQKFGPFKIKWGGRTFYLYWALKIENLPDSKQNHESIHLMIKKTKKTPKNPKKQTIKKPIAWHVKISFIFEAGKLLNLIFPVTPMSLRHSLLDLLDHNGINKMKQTCQWVIYIWSWPDDQIYIHIYFYKISYLIP